MLSVGEIVALQVEKPAAGGWMIARKDGQIVLVGGAIPGERVRARVDRVTRQVAYATTVSVDEPSSDRQEAMSDPRCGGALLAHIAYPRQLALKAQIVADACARIGRFPSPADLSVAGSPCEGYRMRARLHVREGRAGFYREGSHTLCDARATRQLLPASSDALDRLLEFGPATSFDTVAEVELSENVDASERAVHLMLTPQAEVSPWRAVSVQDGWTGVSTGSPAAGATVLAGSPYVTDQIEVLGATMTLRRHVLSFFQGNRFLLRRLAEHVSGLTEPNSTVVDLYAGVGLFAVAVAASRDARVTAVEGDRTPGLDLLENAQVLSGAVEVVRQSVEEFCARQKTRPDLAIVDPPRTGISKMAMTGLVKMKPPRIVYVSCDVATLARDTRALMDAGYTLHGMQAFDLFPNTPHIETVVELRMK